MKSTLIARPRAGSGGQAGRGVSWFGLVMMGRGGGLLVWRGSQFAVVWAVAGVDRRDIDAAASTAARCENCMVRIWLVEGVVASRVVEVGIE